MTEMKDSGIEWLGDIPSHWKIIKFKFIADIYNGNSISDSEKDTYTLKTNIPYIATKDVGLEFGIVDYENGLWVPQNSNFKIAPKGATLLCIEGGSAGKKKAFITRDVAFVNKLCAFVSKKFDNKFLFHFVNSSTFNFQFDKNLSGLIGGVSLGSIKNFFAIFPPLDEQKKIAAFLDKKCTAIDSALDAAKKLVEKLREYKKSLITETVTKGLSPSAEMQDSGIEWLGLKISL